jgi:predicted  nucleic acid-binding Zn ribbon protein
VDWPPLKLMQALGWNPIHCLRCNLEVAPETLPLSPALVDSIVAWRGVYDALDRLWLDSGAYEQWAAGQLADLESEVNRRGLALRTELDGVRRCYYWVFTSTDGTHDSVDDPPSQRVASSCPRCRQMMTRFPNAATPQAVCDTCSLVMASG